MGTIPPVFLPNNEGLQQGIQQIGNSLMLRHKLQQDAVFDPLDAQVKQQAITGNQMDLQKQQEDQIRDADFKRVLLTSDNPERAAFEWSKKNNPELHMKLVEHYSSELFKGINAGDTKRAAANFERVTGERVDVTPDRVEMDVEDENGNVVKQTMIRNPKGNWTLLNKPQKQKSLAEVQGGTLEDLQKKYGTEEGLQKYNELNQKPDQSPTPYGDYRTGDPGKQKIALDFQKASKDPEMADLHKTMLRLSIVGKAQENVSSADIDTAAGAIVAGKMAPSQLAVYGRSKIRGQIMGKVFQLDPEFDAAKAEAGYKFGSATGTQNTLRYMESVDKSIDTLSAISKKLARSNIKILNKAQLAVMEQSGNPDVVAFNTAQVELADQVAKILQGGGTGSGTSDAKLKQAIEIFDRNYSPAQLDAAMGVIKGLIRNRKESMTKGTFMEQKGGQIMEEKSKSGKPIISRDGGKTWEYK